MSTLEKLTDILLKGCRPVVVFLKGHKCVSECIEELFRVQKRFPAVNDRKPFEMLIISIS